MKTSQIRIHVHYNSAHRYNSCNTKYYGENPAIERNNVIPYQKYSPDAQSIHKRAFHSLGEIKLLLLAKEPITYTNDYSYEVKLRDSNVSLGRDKV